MAQARSMWAINWWKNRGSVIYSMDWKNEADKMFIIWLPKQSAEQAIWQASENESFDWLTETIGHYKGCFSLKVKSKCSCTMLKKFIRQCYAGVLWKTDVVSGLELLPSFFFGLWKNFANGLKELVKMIRGMYVCRDVFFILFVEGIACFSCFFSNICQLIFVFLIFYCDKTFKHWQESSSLIRLQFSFIIIFVHK